MIQIKQQIAKNFNAGSKAKQDVEKILDDLDFDFVTYEGVKKPFKNFPILNKIKNEINKIVFIKKLLKTKNKSYFIQHPFSRINIVNKYLAKLSKNNKLYLLIHDIEGLRFNNNRIKGEKILFNACTEIIAHNKVMKQYLINDLHLPSNKIISLDCFDYLTDAHIVRENTTSPVVCFAGNLIKEKASFLYESDSFNKDLKVYLYGSGLEEKNNPNYIYEGAFPSDILPSKLQAGFGLIWDGKSDESDENTSYKKYSKYNNPHKLSLYLAASLPVIVWSKSAIADFVLENNLGFAVDNLKQITIEKLNMYSKYLDNVKKVQKLLLNGYFTKKAIAQICEKII